MEIKPPIISEQEKEPILNVTQLSGIELSLQHLPGEHLFAILYQGLVDYCAQGAVKSIQRPETTQTTRCLSAFHAHTHTHTPPILNNKETHFTHPHQTRYHHHTLSEHPRSHNDWEASSSRF